MAYRFTQTDKWKDGWFSELTTEQKLLFIYITDTCDIAGFIEFTPRIWSAETGIDEKKIINIVNSMRKALVWSDSRDCLFVRNFLKHQNNLPLNPNNKAHVGVLKRFKYYAAKFDLTLSTHSDTGKEGVEVDQIEKLINTQQEQELPPAPEEKKPVINKPKAFEPPSEREVIDYFTANGFSKETAQKAFKYYNTSNWKDSTGKPVKNWKQKMIGVWFKPENKEGASNGKESKMDSLARKANALAGM
ncbi:MAG: hypothetical protein RBS07_17010 [Lentimicrobium sp.]|jgi:hypothetical protein|nr:hypothetical protein [Lentimicrobium sp.]